MEEIYSLHIIVSGRVQGVGFRFFTQNIANSLQLTGFVRNLYNGDVEIYAEGNKDQLEIFLEKVKKGPSLSYVENVQTTWKKIDKKRYNRFNIAF